MRINYTLLPLVKGTKEETPINKDKSQELEKHLSELEAQLTELQSRFPAHSIPADLIMQMDEIDEQISEVRSRLAAIRAKDTGDCQSWD